MAGAAWSRRTCQGPRRPFEEIHHVKRAAGRVARLKALLDHAQMLGHEIGCRLAGAQVEGAPDPFVVIFPAVRQAGRGKGTDDQLGSRHRLFHHPQPDRICGNLCKSRRSVMM